MIIKKIFALLFVFTVLLFPQKIKLGEQTKINSEIINECYFPQFSKDDSKIIFSTESYKGLYAFDLKNKITKIISEENGAGYKPLLLNDEDIAIKTFKVENGRKYYSAYIKNINTGVSEVLEVNKRRISLPQQIVGADFILLQNSLINRKVFNNNNLQKTNQITTAIYSEDNSLFIIKENEPIEISPLGKGVYVWESFSNDGEKIIFTFGNKGAFICDLNGNVLSNIKDAHYPKFSPDGKYVLYMKDSDDGYKYISSDLFVYSFEKNTEYELTNTENKIEMYAEWSNDGKNIVYQTPKGEIYLAKIIIEN
ncbi:MAG: PD40 domain-containing protein [Ignavibacteriales bacterium]|nr:PD40 domain-containing protein [Ignavibacteriales bacterium]